MRITLNLEDQDLFVGVRIRGTLGGVDPRNKIPFKRARSRVQKGYYLELRDFRVRV